MAYRYSQTPNDDQLAQSNNTLPQSTANHVILSMQYKGASSLLRIEPYLKRYRHLPRIPQGEWLADGYGTSRGVDVFVEDHSISPRLVTTLAYSLNDSERLYQDYTEPKHTQLCLAPQPAPVSQIQHWQMYLRCEREPMPQGDILPRAPPRITTA